MNSQETIKRLNNLKTSDNVKFFIVRDKAGNAVSLPSNYRKRKKYLWNRKSDIICAYNYYFRDKQVVKNLFTMGELRIENFILPTYPTVLSWFEQVVYNVIVLKHPIDSELAMHGYIKTQKANTELEEIKTRLAKLERATEVFGFN